MEAFRIERREGVLWARAFAVLDENLARHLGPALAAALGDGAHRCVVLDLSAAPSMTSAGIGFLVKLQTSLTTRGARLFLGSPSPAILDELSARDLGSFFAVVEDYEEDADDEELALFAT